HEAAVAYDVGSENCCEPALDPLSAQREPPRTTGVPSSAKRLPAESLLCRPTSINRPSLQRALAANDWPVFDSPKDPRLECEWPEWGRPGHSTRARRAPLSGRQQALVDRRTSGRSRIARRTLGHSGAIGSSGW